ncbi:MAG TPA: nuclear transport factor 2 family protein [Acidobacteriota bacterium]|nr:nuclear transport factor 2 family protein [Acidobacteriota bacterium]HQO20857.1 nuclear transport factor 2 family protein [Acidobacteriota bacterium]HQQ47691.1 nuclear transport factor 2 family protein [Acidobacteriota bacterium]
MKPARAFRLCLFILIISAAACAPAGKPIPLELEGAGQAMPGDTPGKALNEFIEALNTCDLERTMDLFYKNASAFFPFEEHPKRVEGKEEIRKAFKEFYDAVKKDKQGPRYMNIVPGDIRVEGNDQTAIVSFHVASGPVTSRRTLVMSMIGGRWRIIHLHASNIRVEEEKK